MTGRILAIGFAAAALMFAQGKKGGGQQNNMGGMTSFSAPSRLERISDLLKLNKDQKKDLKTAFDDAQKEAMPLHDQISKARLAIGEAVAGGKSQDDIAKACAAAAQLDTQMAEIELRAFAKVFTELDKDQQQKVGPLYQMMKGLFNGKSWNEAQ
jgi:Spy/CpxP family protein refolding chaperone